MGSTVNVSCPGCGLRGTEQMWGIGMAREWEFFEHRLFCCQHCRSLKSGYVIRKLPALRGIAEGQRARTDERPFELSRQQLAKLLVDARERPVCPDCGGRLSGRSTAEDDDPARCPNCGDELAFEMGGILWD